MITKFCLTKYVAHCEQFRLIQQRQIRYDSNSRMNCDLSAARKRTIIATDLYYIERERQGERGKCNRQRSVG